MPHPHRDRIGLAGNALLVEREKILLVQETKPHVFGQFNLPGGRVETNETVEHCAVREMREETGLRVKPVRFVGIYERVHAVEGSHLLIFVFLVKRIGGRIRPTPEHPEVRFFSLQEIRQLQRCGLLRMVAIPRIIRDHQQGKLAPLSFIKQFP